MAATTSVRKGEIWDFELKRGDKWPPFSFEVVDENEDAISLTSATILMQIKVSMTDSVSVKELTEDDGFIVVGNKVTFDADIDIAVGIYKHDIQVTLNNGDVYTQFYGKIKVVQDVSR